MLGGRSPPSTKDKQHQIVRSSAPSWSENEAAFPAKNRIILVVTVTGWGVVPNYIHLKAPPIDAHYRNKWGKNCHRKIPKRKTYLSAFAGSSKMNLFQHITFILKIFMEGKTANQLNLLVSSCFIYVCHIKLRTGVFLERNCSPCRIGELAGFLKRYQHHSINECFFFTNWSFKTRCLCFSPLI